MSEPSVTVPEIPAGATILDIREDFEFEAGHVEGAQHIPMSQLHERYGEIPMDEDVYIMCRSGGRALRAAAWMNINGFDGIVIEGGMGAWALDNGRPMVSENGEEPRVV